MAKQTQPIKNTRQAAPPPPARRTAAPAAPAQRQASPSRQAPQDEEPSRSTAVAPAQTKATTMPDDFRRMAKADAGKGVSKAAEDNLVPLIYILQALSPVVNPRNADYIDGAEMGKIWLRNNDDPIADGENDGIVAQPCYFSKCWIEWIPRDMGGGFVARHATRPDNAVKVEDPKNPKRAKWMRGENEVIETREHVVRVHHNGSWFPYVIPMTGSNHSASKGWMFSQNSAQFDDGDTAPSFAKVYRLRTKFNKNDQGEWFNWTIKPEGWLYEYLPPGEWPRQYEEGRIIHDAFATGQKQADVSAYEHDDGTGVDGGGDDGGGEDQEDGRP